MSLNIKELIQKTDKDELDKKYLLKIFFKTVFRDIDYTKEELRILDIKKEYSKPYFYNDIDSIIDRTFSNKHCWNNQYFQLQTVSKGCNKGTADVREYAYCIALDFDNHAKEIEQRGKITVKDIVNRFIANKIFCHCIVDTGNGYHAYIMINKTTDFDKVQAVHKALCSRLGADTNAIKPTQVLRIPYSMNVKDFPKEVKIVHLEPYNSTLFKAYDIDFLYKMNVEKQLEEVRTLENNDTTSKYVLNSCNIPYCIAEKIENGSKEGDRYFDLCNIVVALRGCNKPLSQIKEVVKDWSLKSNYNEGLSKVDHIYEKKQHLELDCKGCKNRCIKEIASNFEYEPNEPLIDVDIKLLSKLNKPYRSVEKMKKLTGNEFLVYTVIKNADKDLSTGDIVKLMTFKKKCRISKPTLQKALKGLTDKGIINCKEVGGNKGNVYSLIPHKIKETELITVSYFATILCLSGGISADELKFYYYLRYLLEKQNVLESTTGNILKLRMTDIAREYGVTQQQVSNLISELIEGKILEIYSVTTSKTNGYDYYTYKLIK